MTIARYNSLTVKIGKLIWGLWVGLLLLTVTSLAFSQPSLGTSDDPLAAGGPRPIPNPLPRVAAPEHHLGVNSSSQITIGGTLDALKSTARYLADNQNKLKAAELPPTPIPDNPPPPPLPKPIPAPLPLAPVVIPPKVEDPEPSRPSILLTDRFGVECPKAGKVGEIFVLKTDKCINYKLLKFDVSPYVAYDYDKASKKLVFSTSEPGLYSITVIATSPDGGLAAETYQVQFGETPKEPAADDGHAISHDEIRKVKYSDFVFAKSREAHVKPSYLDSLASIFSSQAGFIKTGGIRTKQELFDATDNSIDSQFTDGQRVELRPLLIAILKEAGQEPDNLDRLYKVWKEVQAGFERASK